MTTEIFTPQLISLISKISVFTNTCVDYIPNHTFNWCVKHKDGHYHLELDILQKQVRFIDYDGDDKTYYAITYVAVAAEFDVDDYFEDDTDSEEEEIEKQMD